MLISDKVAFQCLVRDFSSQFGSVIRTHSQCQELSLSPKSKKKSLFTSDVMYLTHKNIPGAKWEKIPYVCIRICSYFASVMVLGRQIPELLTSRVKPLLRNSDECSYANSIFSDLTQYTNVPIRYKYDKNQQLLSVLFRILHWHNFDVL